MEYGCCSPPIERINDGVGNFTKNIRHKKNDDTTFFSVLTFTVAEQLTNLDDIFLENLEISIFFLKI